MSEMSAPNVDVSETQYPSDTKEDRLQPLHPSARTVWTIKSLLLGAVPVFLAILYDVTGLVGAERALPPGLITAIVSMTMVVLCVVFPRLWYRFWRYSLRGEELFLERGIFNRVSTIVPLRRIQHLDVSQDIVEREFDLGKLIVHTAGTKSSDVVLPGLAFAEAERLRDELKHFILEDTL